MCGVVGLIYGSDNPDMGKEGSELLKRLEYRGYDSTGGAFIADDGSIIVKKAVGAPSKVVTRLGFTENRSSRFIGQVRWATYGAVTDVNSQPHEVRCHRRMVGAHNGNISNTDSLKEFLTGAGHRVLSDNDGEILVHLVEHFYAENLEDDTFKIEKYEKALTRLGGNSQVGGATNDAGSVGGAVNSGGAGMDPRVWKMIDAIGKANGRAKGSYAACFCDPEVSGLFAVKAGSSLYAGTGADAHGQFVVVSSDLTSVLSKTRILIPLREGEGLCFTDRFFFVFSLKGSAAAPEVSVPHLKRSKLGVRDTALLPEYRYYMEQEIRTASVNLDGILRYYFPPRDTLDIDSVFERRKDLCSGILNGFEALTEVTDRECLLREFAVFSTSAEMKGILSRVGASAVERLAAASGSFSSEERILLSDLLRHDPSQRVTLTLIDEMLLWKRRRTLIGGLDKFTEAVKGTASSGGRIHLVASGTSYHAALVAAVFFHDIAGIPVYPVNPGAFRGMYMNTLGKKDLVIGISQSGETKDLVDIFGDLRSNNPDVRLLSVVNNENSRIPQELSDLYLPILCGPEIAVAATKSFVNQLAVFYIIAARLVRNDERVEGDLRHIQMLIAEALEKAGPAISAAAERLYLSPSMHILGATHYGLAREGALKIREVVLNHSEGYDVAEFKHGPNTILGKNTVFSFSQLEAVYRAALVGSRAGVAAAAAAPGTCDKEASAAGVVPAGQLSGGTERSAADTKRNEVGVRADSTAGLASLLSGIAEETLFPGYPLVFLCPPDERDIRITISQIHTHKIRGADIILISEPNDELLKSIAGKPANQPGYVHLNIDVPVSGDRNLFVFPAAVILQLLAFEMSVKKMAFLDRLGIAEHGVNPDTPKNVSKSITVD